MNTSRKHLPYKPTVCLYDLTGFALIIKSSDGIYYHNQVGGHSCMQEVICGNMIPIRDQWGMLARLDSFFAEEANYAGVAGGLRLGDDVKLNRIFQEKHDVNDRRIISPLGFLRIDTEHMPQSVESWLHVIVIDCPVNYPHSLSLSGEPVEIEHLTEESHTTNSGHSNFSGFAGTKAILTWPNSD